MNKKIILISIVFAFLIALIPLRADWSFDKSLRDGLVNIKLSSVTYRLNYCSAYYYYSYDCPCSGNYRQRKYCSSSGWCGSCQKYYNCGSRTSTTTYYCSGNYVKKKVVYSGGCSGNSCRGTSTYYYTVTNCGSRTSTTTYYCSGNYVKKKVVYSGGCSGSSCQGTSTYYYTVTNCGSRTSTTTYYCSGDTLKKKVVYSGGCSGSSCQGTSTYYYTVKDCGSRTCTSRTYYCSGDNLWYKYSCSGGCSGTSCQPTINYSYLSKNCGSRTSTTTYYCSGDTLKKKVVYSGGCSGTSCRSDSTYYYTVKDCGSRTCTSATYYCRGDHRWKTYTCSGGCSDDACRASTTYDVWVENCGSDEECGAWMNSYCKDGDVWHKRPCFGGTCSGGQCYEDAYFKEEKVEDCGDLGCSEGACMPAEGWCWDDSDCEDCSYCSRLAGFHCRPALGSSDNICGHNLTSYGTYCFEQEGDYSICVSSSRLCKGWVNCAHSLCYAHESYESCGTTGWTKEEDLGFSPYRCSGNWLQRHWTERWCDNFLWVGCRYDFMWKNWQYCGPRTYTDSYYCSGNKVYKKVVYSGGCSGSYCRDDSIYTYYQEDCGTSGYEYRYLGGWQQRRWCSRGCSGGSCYENCGTWSNYRQDCGHTCLSHGTASVAWPDCSCQNVSPKPGYERIGTWNSYDCPNCTGYKRTGCSCTSWVNRSCGGGSCSATQRQQTRTCTPSGCSSESRCEADPACVSSPILNLTANPSSIIQGQFSTLQWSSVNTTSCSWTAGLSGSAPTSGSKAVSPITTTAYSMSCTGPSGTISRSTTVTVTVPVINQPPSATNLKVVQPDYCLSGPASIFSWTFTDPDPGDTQSAYRVQVDNNSNFSSPEDDSGKVTSNSNSYATILGKLEYNNTYYWRLKVWDSKDADSNWISGPSFTIPTHAYPEIDFSWSPFKPSVNEDVLFVDESIVYGGTTKKSWSWTFQDGSPDSSNEQNPTAEFSSTGEKDITLRVTDSDGFSCSRTKTLNSQLPLPIWKEIAPF